MISAHPQTLNPRDTDLLFAGTVTENKKGTTVSINEKRGMISFLVGRVLVSRTDDADSSARVPKGPKPTLTQIKGNRSILIVGQWPWRLESVKECVITHLPNEPVPKMDGAKAWSRRHSADGLKGGRPRQVGGCGDSDEGHPINRNRS